MQVSHGGDAVGAVVQHDDGAGAGTGGLDDLRRGAGGNDTEATGRDIDRARHIDARRVGQRYGGNRSQRLDEAGWRNDSHVGIIA